MKISNVITQLQALQAQHGDLEVFTELGDMGAYELTDLLYSGPGDVDLGLEPNIIYMQS